MKEIRPFLHLGAMTATGKTLGENLEDLKRNGFYDRGDEALEKLGVERRDVIRPFDAPFGTDGSIAALKGKLCPDGAVIIRYEGPCGSGMPEMFYTTEAVSSDPALAKSIALLTDGRFSGASRGPAIGHIPQRRPRAAPPPKKYIAAF